MIPNVPASFATAGFDGSVGKSRESFAFKARVMALLCREPLPCTGDVTNDPTFGPLLSTAFASLDAYMSTVILRIIALYEEAVADALVHTTELNIDGTVDPASSHDNRAKPSLEI